MFGLPGVKPIELALANFSVHRATRQVGHFECSNDLLNRIHQLILAAIRSNFQHVLTDCPHREKLGWLEQAYLMGDAMFYNFDAGSFYAKICRDMRDAQHKNGCVPTIAPQYTKFQPPWDVFNDSPEWGSAIVQCPWIAYRFGGDRKILEENYEAMKRYVAYLRSRENADGLIDYGLGDWYDIGPGDPGFSKLTPKTVTATTIYASNLSILSRVAGLLNQIDDERSFRREHLRIRNAFKAKFNNTGSQCADAMAIALQLIDSDDRDAVLAHLIADIRAHENHITAGDIGFRFVLMALAESNRSDVIFDLLTRTDPPSYGAQLAAGATALAEAWDANPKKSQNHLMLGHAESWFYETLAGIRVDLSQAPTHQVTIIPTPLGDIRWVSAKYDSVLGPISIRWDRDGSKLDVLLDAASHYNASIFPILSHASFRRARIGSQRRFKFEIRKRIPHFCNLFCGASAVSSAREDSMNSLCHRALALAGAKSDSVCCSGFDFFAGDGSDPGIFRAADGRAGAVATGGHAGGSSIMSLAWTTKSGDNTIGTLQYGTNDSNFKDASGNIIPRTIVFDVGGTIWLGNKTTDIEGWNTTDRLNIGTNVTIAGQTAPGGITIAGGSVKVNGNQVGSIPFGNDIIRNVSLAPGYGNQHVNSTTGYADQFTYDAMDVNASSVIVDHVSADFATDETISAKDLTSKLTIQYTSESQGQNYPQVDAEASGTVYTGHELGGLISPQSNSTVSLLRQSFRKRGLASCRPCRPRPSI